jgi:hypothetical protein
VLRSVGHSSTGGGTTTHPAIAEQSDLTADFANAWRAADKIVYYTTLAAIPTASTRLDNTSTPTQVEEHRFATASCTCATASRPDRRFVGD